jgi:hypothetical protein
MPIPDSRPAGDTPVSLVRRIRRHVGAVLEYGWELSGSFRHPWADALLIEGREKESGLPLAVFYFGSYDNYAFLIRRLYVDHQIVARHSRVSALQAGRFLTRYADRVDLQCSDVELLYCKLLRTKEFLAVPQWVRQKYDIPNTWQEVVASFRHNTRKTDLRKVRKYGFTYRITQSEHDFREFYHRMYVPYLTTRFTDEVIIEPEWKVLRQCRKGELMQVLRDNRVVAAVLLHRSAGRLAYVWVGVPDDLEQELHTGAFSAAYYFTIVHGYSHGCRLIDFLGSRPVLNDGLFRYKRKWGTYVEDSPVPRGDILLRPVRLGAAVRSFLRTNHFIVRDGQGIAAKILHDNGPLSREDVHMAQEDLYTKGLRSLKLFSLAGVEADAFVQRDRSDIPLKLIDLSGSHDPAGDFCRG